MPCGVHQNFPSNYFTTKQVAWLTAKCPNLKGRVLRPYIDYMMWNSQTNKSDIPAVIIDGKRKPTLVVEGSMFTLKEENKEKNIIEFYKRAEKLKELEIIKQFNIVRNTEKHRIPIMMLL